MAYVRAKVSVDQLAAAMGPMDGAPGYDENGDADPSAQANQAQPDDMRKALQDALKLAQSKSVNDLLHERFNRLMSYGKYKEVVLQE